MVTMDTINKEFSASFENESIKQKTENLSTPIELLIPEYIPLP
jgi:hypothetical protein